MSAVLTRQGAPRPYELCAIQTESGQFVQHAIVRCCDCAATAQIVWRSAEAPIQIVQKFQRMGWETYQNGKARCPEHKHDRARQKAQFAKIGDAMPEVVKMAIPKQEANGAAKAATGPAKTYLLIVPIDGSPPTVRPLEGNKEMLFGEDTYICIPRDSVP